MEPDPSLLSSQVFTTAAQLLGCVDKKLVVVLRDGRKLFGILRSFDQFANLVLQDTIERIYVASPTGDIIGKGKSALHYGDIPRGVFLIRGENVVLVGEIDLDKEEEDGEVGRIEDVRTVIAAQQKEREQRKLQDASHQKILYDYGFSQEGGEGDMY